VGGKAGVKQPAGRKWPHHGSITAIIQRGKVVHLKADIVLKNYIGSV
jgi:hypothetical protein